MREHGRLGQIGVVDRGAPHADLDRQLDLDARPLQAHGRGDGLDVDWPGGHPAGTDVAGAVGSVRVHGPSGAGPQQLTDQRGTSHGQPGPLPRRVQVLVADDQASVESPCQAHAALGDVAPRNGEEEQGQQPHQQRPSADHHGGRP